MQKIESQSYVKNSSFLSKDIEAQKGAAPKREKSEVGVASPPISTFLSRANSKEDSPKERANVMVKQESVIKEAPKESKVEATAKELQRKLEKLSDKPLEKVESIEKVESKVDAKSDTATKAKDEESNGVGDKIKKFEKAAEDASANVGKSSRAGSVRRRSERSGSESDFPPPPAVPFRDLDTALSAPTEKQKVNAKWQKSGPEYDPDKIRKPEPQRIIKPEFKPAQSPVEVTIRSPSLGTKISDSFPSQGTAFRNVAPVAPVAPVAHVAPIEHNDVNTQNNVKACKVRKEKYSVSKGSSYFTRGSEEIWLVKKKDIEEIEERVMDSFRRAGGNVCVRSESVRPSSDSGQNAMSHTMGRTKRQMYARSESLDPQQAGNRAQTLKRQTSVACTCGHDKNKARSKSSCESARPRSRSHGDDHAQAQVLDKYETLV